MSSSPKLRRQAARRGLSPPPSLLDISRMSDDEAICKAVNGFLHDRFPGGSWTSIAILCNPKMGLHRDIGT